jgi:hypothetical protein
MVDSGRVEVLRLFHVFHQLLKGVEALKALKAGEDLALVHLNTTLATMTVAVGLQKMLVEIYEVSCARL